MAAEIPASNMLPNDNTSSTASTLSPPPFRAEQTTDSSSTGEMGEALSPMRTHEQFGHTNSVADKFAHLVEESDDEEQALDVNKVDHDRMERKELTRQKTSEGGKANRLRDRLKRTVSKTADSA